MTHSTLSINNTYSNCNPLIDKIITYKNIKPNYNLIKNLPAHNYIKCFCPIHGDQLDNDKHKCSTLNENGNHCISSLRYNCVHCSNENGRSLSHIAFQKHLRKFHSGILEKMKIKDSIGKTESIIPMITSKIPLKENSISDNKNKKNDISNNNSKKSLQLSKRKVINIAKKDNLIPCHKIQINSFKIKKNKSISIVASNFKNTHSSPFLSLQLICACELLIEKALEVAFHESYLSYDIPTKLMILRYALTDNKIICEHSIKEKC